MDVSARAVDTAVLVGQLGREPRDPWRTECRCSFGFPTVIVSPPVLADGSRFPSYAWLSCPWLAQAASAEESHGALRQWSARLDENEVLRNRLLAADHSLRQARAACFKGEDPCESVGLAGQRDPLAVKCLHAHVALAVLGLDDPIGLELLSSIERECPDERCRRYSPRGGLQ